MEQTAEGGLNRGADALILGNPVCLARRGLSLDDLVDLMARVGLRARAEALADERDLAALRALVREANVNMVIAAGGDGTVHEVVNVIAPLAVPLGLLPLGTANDFARTLHLPGDLEAAAAVIADAPPLAVDLGKVNGQVFLNAAHLGLGVETAKRTNPTLKGLVGPIAYALAATQAYLNAEPFELEVCTEDDPCLKLQASQLLVGNGRYFGGGMVIDPEATLDDGLLDVHVISAELGAAEALRLAAALRQGTLGELPHAIHFRTARVTARLARSLEINLDGEVRMMEPPLRFEVAPRALSVYARSTSAQSAWSPVSIATGIS
jgi:YegS/Rv2252/BmrU family lipid kinase